MHANLFDPYLDRKSLVHQLDPRVKLVLAVLLILSNLTLPDGAWLAFAVTGAVIWVGGWLSKVSPVLLVRRASVVIPFTLAAVTVIFSTPGDILATGSLGSWHWTATDAGTVRFGSILLRSWFSVQVAILLTTTTRFPDLLHAMHHLRVPRPLVAIIALMYRYLFVLVDEVVRLLRARRSRSGTVPGHKAGRSLPWRARVAGGMVGQLFLRSYERSQRVHSAMLSRGYQGEFYTLTPHQMDGQDWAFGLFSLAIILSLQFIGRALYRAP
jgi:cobalt/nickel transport system permease protein